MKMKNENSIRQSPKDRRQSIKQHKDLLTDKRYRPRTVRSIKNDLQTIEAEAEIEEYLIESISNCYLQK